MRFKKIKYNQKDVMLLWTTESDGETHEHTLTSKAPPHPDFIDALALLAYDLVRVCELPIAYEEGLRVQSVTFSHSEKTGTSGAVITGLKTLAASTAPLVLNTPHLVEEGESGVMSMTMRHNLEILEREAQRYIEGKRAQGELFDAAEEEDEEEAAV